MTPRTYASFREDLDRAVALALDEDLTSDGDVTTTSTVPEDLRGDAEVVAKGSGVMCGIDAFDAVYEALGSTVDVRHVRSDGDTVTPGDVVVRLAGPVWALLTGERAALNLLTHLSGIATMVRAATERAGEATIVDTRKTLPGLRELQKYAVRTGGATNHRFGLSDGVLVKDNHIVAAGGVGEATRRAKAGTTLPVQVECASFAEAEEALGAGADSLLLDNFDPVDLARTVDHLRRIAPQVVLEASGGITMDTISSVAASGVDRISVGAFTHSAPALDVSFRLVRVEV